MSNQRKSIPSSPSPVRTPPDHQLTTGSSTIHSSSFQSLSSYDGDSEDRGGVAGPYRHEKASPKEKAHSSNYLDPDSSSAGHGHPPHSQQTRQLYVLKTPNNSSRCHRSYSWGDTDKVTLLVDGKRFTISPNLLIKHPNTMLGRYIHVVWSKSMASRLQ